MASSTMGGAALSPQAAGLLWGKYPMYEREDSVALLDPVSLESVVIDGATTNPVARRGLADHYEEPLRDLGFTREPRERTTRSLVIDGLDRLGIDPAAARVGGYRIVVTDRCNMRCSYCFVHTNTGRPDLSEQDLRAGLEYLFESNAGKPSVSIQWFGGEPTIRFDLMQAGDAYADELADRHGVERVVRTVVTNGVRLTDEMIQHFERYRYGVGVSLDGPADQQTGRTLLSGRPAHERIEANLDRLLKSRVLSVGCNLTPTAATVVDIPQITKWIIEDCGVRFIYVNTPIPANGRWPVSGRALAEALFEARLVALGRGGMVLSALDRVYQALDSRHPHVYEHLQADGSLVAALLPGGRVSICDLNWREPEFVFPIEVLRDSPHLLSRVAKRPMADDRCLTCPAMAICGGPSENDRSLRGLDSPDPEMCEFFERAVELAIWDTVGLQ